MCEYQLSQSGAINIGPPSPPPTSVHTTVGTAPEAILGRKEAYPSSHELYGTGRFMQGAIRVLSFTPTLFRPKLGLLLVFLIRVFFLLFFFYFGIFFASAAPQRPTCSYHANPAGFPTRNNMSLQVGEMPDSNPGLQVLQPGALPLSHHIPMFVHFNRYKN